MTQSGKLLNGGLALILISSTGCAGNGLRNMFSRNETAGYKTLEELEEERIAAEKNSEDESGPRFASWLPFGKKAAEETEEITADDTVADSDEAKKDGWWRNPFRRQETIEPDPFLENELPTEVIVAGKKEAKASAEEVASSSKSKAKKDVAAVEDRLVKAASATKEAEATAEDDLLVEKFEKHFQQTTEATVSSAEESSDLIVAGIAGAATDATASKKKAVSSAENVSGAADKKLAEFEELLASKKATAAKARKEVQFEDQLATAEEAADEFAESLAEAGTSVTKQASKSDKQTVASVDDFDSLFEPAEKPVAAKKKKIGATRASSAEGDDVKVAKAEDIFGAEAVSGKGGGRQTKKSSSVGGGWKGEESESSVAAGNGADKSGKGQETDLARKVIDKTVDHFAAMFSGANASDGAPVATAPDADEWTASSQGEVKSGGRWGVPVRTASNGRELGAALETPGGLKEDKFFSGGGNAPLVTNLQAVPESAMTGTQPAAPVIRENSAGKEESRGIQLPSTFSVRNIVLVIGVMIVAALLFAPGRKKPTVANQLPTQG